MDDTRLSTALHDAFDGVEAPTVRLIDGALRRSHRRTRRAHLATGATAAVLVSAIVAVVAVSGARPPDRPAPAAVGSTATSGVTSKPPTISVRPALVPTTPQALLQIALDSLPYPGHTDTYTGRRIVGGGDVFVATEFVFDDGHGAAQLAVSLETGGESSTEFCTNALGQCTHPTADSTLSIYQGNSRPGDATTAKEWNVELFRADGVTVSISEWNAPSEKDVAATRDQPPFTRQQLITWANDNAFAMRVSPHMATATRHLFIAD